MHAYGSQYPELWRNGKVNGNRNTKRNWVPKSCRKCYREKVKEDPSRKVDGGQVWKCILEINSQGERPEVSNSYYMYIHICPLCFSQPPLLAQPVPPPLSRPYYERAAATHFSLQTQNLRTNSLEGYVTKTQ